LPLPARFPVFRLQVLPASLERKGPRRHSPLRLFTSVMSQRLANYLRTYRKHAGLSQNEVAFLLGGESGTKVSRYEQSARLPSLETALAYEAMFGIPPRELFAGIFVKVETATMQRAETLATKLHASPNREMQLAKRKLAGLERIASRHRLTPAESI
jgi:transcriptional regulator with XRE-family HTH domain